MPQPSVNPHEWVVTPQCAPMQASAYLKLSVATAIVTIALKSAAWWWTGSVSLAADALESLVNLAGAVFALAMITLAAQPPDAEHPYGHHKAEYFSSGFEGILIIAAALGICWGAVDRWRHPEPLNAVGVGIGLAETSGVWGLDMLGLRCDAF